MENKTVTGWSELQYDEKGAGLIVPHIEMEKEQTSTAVWVYNIVNIHASTETSPCESIVKDPCSNNSLILKF